MNNNSVNYELVILKTYPADRTLHWCWRRFSDEKLYTAVTECHPRNAHQITAWIAKKKKPVYLYRNGVGKIYQHTASECGKRGIAVFILIIITTTCAVIRPKSFTKRRESPEQWSSVINSRNSSTSRKLVSKWTITKMMNASCWATFLLQAAKGLSCDAKHVAYP